MKRLKKRRSAVSVPVASMGDIAFLLIIFFMVCSNFIKEAQVKLEPPQARDLTGLSESPVSVSVDKEGKIYLQGSRVPDAEAIEYGVSSLIKDQVTEEGRTVIFKCDEEVDKAVFEPVLDAISRGGGLIAAVGLKKTEGGQ